MNGPPVPGLFAGHLEAGLHAGADAAMLLNPQQLIVYANPALAALAGLPVAQIEGREAVELMDSLSREPFSKAFERVARESTSSVEVTVGTPPHALDVSLVGIRASDGVWVLCLGRVRALPLLVEQRLGELNRRYDEKVRELASLTGKLRELATTDPLSNLFNRRAFIDRAEVEWSRARRHGLPLACTIIDIDHFKRINDQHGHATGDEVIRIVGSLLRTTVRTVDIPARLGGEEFVALLPQTSTEGAVLLAERVRTRITDHLVRTSGGIPLRVTCSAGVATSESGYATFSELLAAADAALYEAKRAGRDCVRVATRPAAAGPT